MDKFAPHLHLCKAKMLSASGEFAPWALTPNQSPTIAKKFTPRPIMSCLQLLLTNGKCGDCGTSRSFGALNCAVQKSPWSSRMITNPRQNDYSLPGEFRNSATARPRRFPSCRSLVSGVPLSAVSILDDVSFTAVSNKTAADWQPAAVRRGMCCCWYTELVRQSMGLTMLYTWEDISGLDYVTATWLLIEICPRWWITSTSLWLLLAGVFQLLMLLLLADYGRSDWLS